MFLRRFYGPRNERFDPRQLLFFGLKIDEMPLDEASIAEESQEELATRRVAKRHKHGRHPLPDHLPRIDIEHDLDDSEKPCPACGELRERIGQEVSEQLEYLPASFKVLRHIRHKYGCRRCEHDGYNPQIAAAAKPAQPIDKGLPGPGLLGLRRHQQAGRPPAALPLGAHLSRGRTSQIARSTMCAWLAAAGELVRPLVARMTERVLLSRAMHTDDTPVPMQSPGEGKCRKGRLWAYLGDASQSLHRLRLHARPDAGRPGQLAPRFQGLPASRRLRRLRRDLSLRARSSRSPAGRTPAASSSRRRRPTAAAPPRCSRWCGNFTRSRMRPRRWTTTRGASFANRRACRSSTRIKAWLDAEQQDRVAAQPDGPGDRVRLEPVERLVRLRDRGLLGHRQQRRRAGDEARGHRPQELALRRQRPGGRNHGAALHADRQRRASRRRSAALPDRASSQNCPSRRRSEIDQFLPDVWKQDDVAEPAPSSP